MIIIEFKKILKEGSIIFLVLLGLFLGLLFTDKDYLLAPMLQIFLLLYASFTGWAMFDRERQEGAMEYLLSLPVSRIKLLFLKFLPRFTSVSLVLALFALVYGGFAKHFHYSFFTFALAYGTVFLLSLSLALAMRSFLGTFFIAILVSGGLFYLIQYLDPTRENPAIATQAALSLLAVPAVFFAMFQKFDMKPVSHFNFKLVPALVFILLSILTATFLSTGSRWWHYHLTPKGHLFRESSGRTVFLSADNKKRVFDHSLVPMYEDGNLVYLCGSTGWQKPETLERLDVKSGKREVLYRGEAGWWFHGGGRGGVSLEDRKYFLLTGPRHESYRVLEVSGQKTRTLDVDFGVGRIHSLYAVYANPLRFLVFSDEGKVFYIHESGEVEELLRAGSISAWRDRLLVTSKEGLAVYETAPGLKRLYFKNWAGKVIPNRAAGKLGRQVPLMSKNKFFIFDMKDYSLTGVPLKGLPFGYVTSEQGLRFVGVNQEEISVSEWSEGRLRIEKVWYSAVDPGKSLRIIRVFPAGITVYGKHNYEIYIFGDQEGGEFKRGH